MKKLVFIFLLLSSIHSFGHGCNLDQDQQVERLSTQRILEMISLGFVSSHYEELSNYEELNTHPDPQTQSATTQAIIKKLKNTKHQLRLAIKKSPNRHKKSVRQAKKQLDQIEHQLRTLLTKAISIRTQLLNLTHVFIPLRKAWYYARKDYFFLLHPEVTLAFAKAHAAHVKWADNQESLPYLSNKVKNSLYAQKLDNTLYKNMQKTSNILSLVLKKHDKTENYESEMARIYKEELEHKILDWNATWSSLFYHEFYNVKLHIQKEQEPTWEKAQTKYYQLLGPKVVEKATQVSQLLKELKHANPQPEHQMHYLFGSLNW